MQLGEAIAIGNLPEEMDKECPFQLDVSGSADKENEDIADDDLTPPQENDDRDRCEPHCTGK